MRGEPDASGAEDLVIAGLVPFSSVDWPGLLTATVFLQGCPWRCTYCHNPALLPCRVPTATPWGQVRDVLRRRQGLLDAVVFTGGEATRQVGPLCAAMDEVVQMGYSVGLHTAGAYPRHLAQILPHMDGGWVGLDLKALPEHYGEVVGQATGGEKAWSCLEIIDEFRHCGGQVELEVRITVLPEHVTSEDALAVAQRCREHGVTHIALQQVRQPGVAGVAAPPDPTFTRQCQQQVAQLEDLGFEKVIFRAA